MTGDGEDRDMTTTTERVAAGTARGICDELPAPRRRLTTVRTRRAWRATAVVLGLGGLVAVVAGAPVGGCIVVEQAAMTAAVLSL